MSLLFVLALLRLVWRLGHEQIEPMGSWGTGLLGRTRVERPED
jgi:hypothetical protein